MLKSDNIDFAFSKKMVSKYFSNETHYLIKIQGLQYYTHAKDTPSF